MMKKYWTLMVLLLAFAPLTLTGCGSDEPAPVEVDETFDAAAAEEQMASEEGAPEGPAP